MDDLKMEAQVGRVKRWRPRVRRSRACREGLGDGRHVGRG